MSILDAYAPTKAAGSEVERLRRRLAVVTEENRRLRRREALLRTAVDSGGVGWWLLEHGTKRVEGSAAFKANFGRAADDPAGYDEIVAQVHPDDRPRREAAMAQSLAGGGQYRVEYRVRWPNGEERELEMRGAPVFGARRQLLGMAGVSIDVTPRKKVEARDRLLREELNHRLKNAMTTVQALASHSLRDADSPEVFRERFGARLEALGRSLALPDEGEAATLAGVLAQALAPYCEASGDRIVLDGPIVLLTPRQAQALGLMAHELATNAVKYGALSGETGRVSVTWALDDDEAQLLWRESGGPAVTPPTRRGFGSRLIERAAPLELGGRATVDYGADGVRCRLSFPLRG